MGKKYLQKPVGFGPGQGVRSGVRALACSLKGLGLVPSQGHVPSFQVQSLGPVRARLGVNQSMSLSYISVSPPPSPSLFYSKNQWEKMSLGED